VYAGVLLHSNIHIDGIAYHSTSQDGKNEIDDPQEEPVQIEAWLKGWHQLAGACDRLRGSHSASCVVSLDTDS
jgi:hypothetical protein